MRCRPARRASRRSNSTPLFDGATLGPGLKTIKQQGPGTAVVQDTDGKKQLLASSSPLEARAPDGKMAPVDLDLRESSDRFQTTNSTVDLQVAKHPGDGIRVPSQGFSIAQQSAADSTTGVEDRSTDSRPETA